MRTLVINKSNVVNDGRNSRFRYQFSQAININQGDQISLVSAEIPYSNFNIMAQFGNNTFSYNHPAGGSWSVVFPDGFYTIDDMNYFLQQTQILNNHYLINSDGEIVYYLKLSTNQNRYKIQLDTFAIPATLPTNWTNPGSFNLTLYGGKCFNFVFSSGQKFQQLLGFNDGNYGTNNSTNTSYLSQNVPSVALVNSYMITIPNLVNQSNIASNSNSAIFVKSPDVDFGNNINMTPAYPIYIDINPGVYSYIDIVLASGDDSSQLYLQDPNSLFLLVIKNKTEISN